MRSRVSLCAAARSFVLHHEYFLVLSEIAQQTNSFVYLVSLNTRSSGFHCPVDGSVDGTGSLESLGCAVLNKIGAYTLKNAFASLDKLELVLHRCVYSMGKVMTSGNAKISSPSFC